MSRREFLEQLERLLWDIPEQERKEALEYYRDYFEDAGEENESKVIQELGSPGKVAAIIKADLRGSQEEHGEYTESGYGDERFDDRNMPDVKGNTKRKYTGEGNTRKVPWALFIVLLILSAPIWGGLGIGFLGVIFGVLAGGLGILAAIFISSIALFAAGVAVFVYGAVYMIASPAAGLAAAGVGLLLAAAGLLLILAFMWLAFKALPFVFRKTVDFIQGILHSGRKRGDRV